MDQEMQKEQEYLASIKEIANRQILSFTEEAERSESEILHAQQEMWGETAHGISGGLWGSESFEQLVEMSQFTSQISVDVTLYETKLAHISRLERLLSSPYFARIDFTFENNAVPQHIYIGRCSLIEDHHILIHDWRAPISGLFYQYGLGKASYRAPVGLISGTVEQKRQYEIRKGVLEYFFDADLEISDTYLRTLLAQNTSTQMRSIVETIQKEQDVVIRDGQNDVLIVQGVAGSGKTSVALHRVAYLMYRGLSNYLSSHHIVILSPNDVFGQYISHVLPDLGEKNVESFLLENIYRGILGVFHVQSRFQWMEQVMANEGAHWVSVMEDSLRFKCSKEFGDILDGLEVSSGDFSQIFLTYQRLFAHPAQLQAIARRANIPLPSNLEDILLFTRQNLASSLLFFDDASALTYLSLKDTAVEEYGHIRQVVIDEAQDYYPLHYRIIKRLFPNAKYTILGDIHQTIRKREDMDFYQGILSVMNKNKSALVTLDKSFRCTNEIIRFASGIIGKPIRAFGRDGVDPYIRKLRNGEEVAPLIADVKTCLEEGFHSVGILCKSQRECKELYQKLREFLPVHLLDPSSKKRLFGVLLLPFYLAKGLEFDAAFLWQVDDERFGKEEDRSLLFVGCTRAMHRLYLYYWGKISPFIPVTTGGEATP